MEETGILAIEGEKKIKDERECLMNEKRNIPAIFETFQIFFNGFFLAVIVIFI